LNRVEPNQLSLSLSLTHTHRGGEGIAAQANSVLQRGGNQGQGCGHLPLLLAAQDSSPPFFVSIDPSTQRQRRICQESRPEYSPPSGLPTVAGSAADAPPVTGKPVDKKRTALPPDIETSQDIAPEATVSGQEAREFHLLSLSLSLSLSLLFFPVSRMDHEYIMYISRNIFSRDAKVMQNKKNFYKMVVKSSNRIYNKAWNKGP
jgi:hypothetical protein